MSEKRSHCPVCGNTREFTSLSENEPVAVSCGRCGLGIETAVRLRPADYTIEQYDKVRNAGDGGDRWAKFHHDSAVASDRVFHQLDRAIAGYPPGALWLDIGCGNGALLALLRRKGWAVTGVEFDKDACAALGTVLGLPAVSFDVWSAIAHSGMPGGPQASVVSLFDSLEHMLDPVGAVLAAAKTVMPDGLIIIELPDLDAGRDDFRNWKHRRITESFTEHIWHFSRLTLETLAANHLPGFDTVSIARPVEGRLQAVFKRKAATAAPVSDIDFEKETRRFFEDQRLESRYQQDLQDQLEQYNPLTPVTITTK